MTTDTLPTDAGTGLGTAASPKAPRNIEETGLSESFLVELVCKSMYYGGVMPLSAVSERLALPVSIVNDVLEFMKKERLAEVKRGGDVRASYTYALTDLGRDRAREYLNYSGYVGAAPVTLAQYSELVRKNTIRGMTVTRKAMGKAFAGVVLPEGMVDRLGPAVNSGRSIFLYGPSGTGKTFIAERLAGVLSGTALIPYAICVDNQVIRVFDPVNHRPADPPAPSAPGGAVIPERNLVDRRWVPCRRPVVIAGGELTLSMLDLSYDQVSKFYEAPLQVKANGGIFLIDDLGRQLVRPFDLLNRWIVPLEKARDYLALQNGQKFEVPFDQIILFSTNIEPRDLADEAFLRRIGYKIRIEYLGDDEYIAISRQVCERLGVAFRPEVIRYLIDAEHGGRGLRLSACHPQDIISRVVEICRYEDRPPQLDNDLVKRACRDYFTAL